jgi:hypothetical protein
MPVGGEWARRGRPAGFESRWRHSKRTAGISAREAGGRLRWDHGVPREAGSNSEGPSQHRQYGGTD